MGSLESIASGHILRLVLEQTADRVAHRIELWDRDLSLLAELRSVEGTSAQAWPPSPPLQSSSLQEVRPGENAAFLVGMAGRSHWSASIEPIPGRGAIVFDFACRVQQAPDWLGTTYSVHAANTGKKVPIVLSSSAAILSLGNVTLSMSAQPAGEIPPAINPTNDGGLQVACRVASPVLRPITFRWRYCLSIGQAP